MLKRLAVVGAAVAGVVFLRKKAKQQQAEQDLWTQATDDVHAPVAPPAPSTLTTPPVATDEASPSA